VSSTVDFYVYRGQSIWLLKRTSTRKLQKRARANSFPGGVNSPVRAFSAVGADPVLLFAGVVRAYGMRRQ